MINYVLGSSPMVVESMVAQHPESMVAQHPESMVAQHP